MPDAVYHIDRDWRFTYVNTAAEQIMGLPSEDLVGRSAPECFPEVLGTVIEDEYRAVLTEGRARHFEYFYARQGRWYEIRAFPQGDGLTAFLRDIDEQHRLEQGRARVVRQLTAVLDALPSPTVVLDGGGRIVSVNRAWTAIGRAARAYGVRQAGVGDDYLSAMGQSLAPHQLRTVAAGLRSLAAHPTGMPEPSFAHDYSVPVVGRLTWYRLQAARVEHSDHVVITHTDITERMRDQERLAWQATHDDLTGLPNRSWLLELTGAALAEEEWTGAALLLLDLDGFKTINDSLGHEVGDELLRLVAGRLSEHIRPGDVVARLGGDQFIVLAEGCDASEAAALAFRLQTVFVRPFTAGEISVPLSASIGVAVARPGVRDAHHLLSDADAAMFAAKNSGRDRVHLFSPPLREAARWRLEVATRLREDAIDQLVVHYQPVVRLDTGEVEAVEALVRWQHPERGLLPPDTFLSVAEETGQIIPITRWLLQETTRRAAGWAAEGLPLRMSVNISARHFSAETLVSDVRIALQESGLPADQLVLELTETSVAEDPTRAEDQLSVLRSSGVRVAIDDFGTGWSSLAQLFSLPIGTLKIDRSLLAAAERVSSGDTGAVLTAIVGLTRTLGIRSVAEGIETLEHLRMVRAAGCDMAQGWLLGYPMPADCLRDWLREVQRAGGDVCALAAAGRAVPACR